MVRVRQLRLRDRDRVRVRDRVRIRADRSSTHLDDLQTDETVISGRAGQ